MALEAPTHLTEAQQTIWQAVIDEMGDALAQTDAVTIEAFVVLWSRAREAAVERDKAKEAGQLAQMARWESMERQAWTALRPYISELAASPLAKKKLDKLSSSKNLSESLGANPMTAKAPSHPEVETR